MTALKDQTVVVFGGSSGVGLASAELLASHGARLVIAGRDGAEVEKVVPRLGSGARGFTVDGKDEAAIARFFKEIGEIDHLVIPAGATNRGGTFVDQMTEQSFRATFDGKFWVQINVAHAGATHVKRGGSITFFSGGAAHRALRGMVNIAAVNAAIEAVVPPLSLELAPTRVNAICPGTLATTYWSGVPEEQLKKIFADTAEKLPAGRVGTAEEIANAVLFLVTTPYATGMVLRVDGGMPHSTV